MTTAIPYSYGEAKHAIERSSQNMLRAEEFIRDVYRQRAAAERAYRVALAQEITRLKADGVAWSSTADLARGEKHVADLRYLRDVAEGVRESARSASWRHSADRRELEQLIAWSMKIAPEGQYEECRPVRSAA